MLFVSGDQCRCSNYMLVGVSEIQFEEEDKLLSEQINL